VSSNRLIQIDSKESDSVLNKNPLLPSEQTKAKLDPVIKYTIKQIFQDYKDRATDKNLSFLQKVKTNISSAFNRTNADANKKDCDTFSDRIDAVDDPESKENLIDTQILLCKTGRDKAKSTTTKYSECSEAFYAASNYLNRLHEFRNDSDFILAHNKKKQTRIEEIKALLAASTEANSKLIASADNTATSEAKYDDLMRELVYLGDYSLLKFSHEIKRLFPKTIYEYPDPKDVRPAADPQVNFNYPLVLHKNWLELYLQKYRHDIKVNKVMIPQYEKIANANAKGQAAIQALKLTPAESNFSPAIQTSLVTPVAAARSQSSTASIATVLDSVAMPAAEKEAAAASPSVPVVVAPIPPVAARKSRALKKAGKNKKSDQEVEAELDSSKSPSP
jgi:hypothetical protein